MSLGDGPSSDQLQIAAGSGNHRSSSSIPSTGGADNLSADIALKSASVDFGCGGDLSSLINVGGVMGESIFKWVDNASFTPLKLSTEPALANVESELSKATLSSVGVGTQTGANIQGNTGILSGGGGQEH